MKYEKPEIYPLGDAAAVIQGCLKFRHGFDPDGGLFMLQANYDLDE